MYIQSLLNRRLHGRNQEAGGINIRSVPVELVNIVDIRSFQAERIAQGSILILPHEIPAVEKKSVYLRIVRCIDIVPGETHG